MKVEYTLEELKGTLQALENMFDCVRLVDPSACIYYKMEGERLIACGPCYAAWGKDARCTRCVADCSLRAKERKVKYEFTEEDVYSVIGQYAVCEGREFVIEIICKVGGDVALEARGNHEFLDRVTSYNSAIYTDALTNVYNRRYISDYLHRMIPQADCHNYSLAIVDVDHFKRINDTYGHLAGDDALIALSKLLSSRISGRRGDFVVRLGGDEFLLLFNDLSQEVFQKRMRELIYRAAAIGFKKHPGLSLSLSIGGVSQSEYPDADYKTLISIADQRLYKAKRRGRNCEVTCNEV